MTRVTALLVTGIICSLYIIGPVSAPAGDVILSFNARADNSVGLTWANGYLWNIDHGHNVPAVLLQLDPSDGSVLSSLTLPLTHGMGLTWDGSSFWVVSHEDSVIYQIDPDDGSIIHSFPTPNPGTVEVGCEGLAWDGQNLWYADSDLDTIFQLWPINGQVLNSFPSPSSSPQGLAWDGGFLWHFDLGTRLIYKLNALDGSILTSFGAPANGEGDLAWDGSYLWLCRNAADTIYKIDVGIVPPVAEAGEDQTVYEGDTVQFDGSASYDPDGIITFYEWDLDANVDSDWDGITTNDVDATGPTPMYQYGDNGVYTVTLNVTDNQGFHGIDTCSITVYNLAPTIEPLGPFTGEKGYTFVLNATASVPGSDDLIFTWNWGDGSPDNVTVYYNNDVGPDPYPSPQGTFPFSATDMVEHSYDHAGVYTINLTVEDDDGGLTFWLINITVINVPPPPPVLFVNVSQDGRDAVLNWDPPSDRDLSHYLLYRTTSQTAFDFKEVWINTSRDKEEGETCPGPLRTMWNDTNAALPGNVSYKEQYYYIIRAVDDEDEVSSTSRTVGKWTKTFQEGVSTFSLPLEPLEPLNVDNLTSRMNADYIKYLDPINHTWRQHNLGDGDANNTQTRLGEGYEVKFETRTNYTFTGMPGAVITYNDGGGFFGFDPAIKADNLQLAVHDNGDVNLTWQEPATMGVGDWYEVYYSFTRDGFFGTLNDDYFLASSAVKFGNNSLLHTGADAAHPGTQLYYMVVPFNSSGVRGSSTYSMGIWTEEYLPQYDTFGIPLKIDGYDTADWYCDNIPDTVGINHFNLSNQRWCWHSTRMSAGAFDPVLEMTEGYQISTSNVTQFIFIGV